MSVGLRVVRLGGSAGGTTSFLTCRQVRHGESGFGTIGRGRKHGIRNWKAKS